MSEERIKKEEWECERIYTITKDAMTMMQLRGDVCDELL